MQLIKKAFVCLTIIFLSITVFTSCSTSKNHENKIEYQSYSYSQKNIYYQKDSNAIGKEYSNNFDDLREK